MVCFDSTLKLQIFLFLKYHFYTLLVVKVCMVVLIETRCMLHNFGGNIEMYGILDSIASGPIDARTSHNSTMVHFTLFY